jgi:hypothetical protein
MQKLIQLEEAILFAGCLYVFPYFGLSWWWFAALILTPDVGMLGYLGGPKTGAYLYNIFHHKGVALIIALAGALTGTFALVFAGYILFSHSSLDRMLGYGLKFEKGFRYTHLGVVGKPD